MTLPSRNRPALLAWLLLCAALVALMVLIGGYTRLSGSGLSITSWKPVHGIIPPLNAGQWQEEFDAYRQSPQYIKVNRGMQLEEFKAIFWPEFIHRLLGRVIGAVFFLPLIVFALRRSFNRRFGWRLAGIFALGGLQGIIGWMMVRSGLQDDPQVSPVYLAAHLAVAFGILGMILWAGMDVLTSPSPNWGEGRGGGLPGRLSPVIPLPNPPPCRGRGLYLPWFSLLCLQIILGALMAGLHGGLIYNTWPTMDGHWIPDELLAASPWYANVALVQFMHRTLAVFLAVSYLAMWLYNPKTRPHNLIAATLAAQFALGVATLLHQAPLALALAHQMTGLLLFSLSVIALHRSCESLATPQNS